MRGEEVTADSVGELPQRPRDTGFPQPDETDAPLSAEIARSPAETMPANDGESGAPDLVRDQHRVASSKSTWS